MAHLVEQVTRMPKDAGALGELCSFPTSQAKAKTGTVVFSSYLYFLTKKKKDQQAFKYTL